MTKPKLTYFAVRGLAEPIRVLLKDANVDYTAVDYNLPVDGKPDPNFLTLKSSGVLDYGSIPLWEEDGLHLVQSFAIARHLARKYGYNGENENEAAKIDAVVEGCRDFSQAVRKVATVPAEQKEQTWKETASVEVPKWLGFFENILKKNGTAYFVGKKVSLADLFIMTVVEEVKAANIPLEAYPLLSAHQTMMHARPHLAPYVADPARYPPNVTRFVPK
eukprot:Phypoly_transcript_16901.p1 GENE.Phypoly_transcript_16901~~Phypoly_transcript_16901.p1  ORF type:complete len:241 (+),score=48.53 Phypoly_transcript_16901:67-723(+)